MTTDTYMVPVWALPYLIYNDTFGLPRDYKDVIDQWLKSEGIAVVIKPDDADDSFFCERPVFGGPCRVVECECVLD